MSLWKCNTCLGTYRDSQPDGTLYMHACPPTVLSAGLAVPIVNPRDENVVIDAHGFARDIRLAGSGVTPMQAQTNAEPQWILSLRVAAAALPAGL